MSNTDLMSPAALAQLSGWPEHRIRKLIKLRKLRFVRIGKKYLLPRDALEAYLEANMIEPATREDTAADA